MLIILLYTAIFQLNSIFANADTKEVHVRKLLAAKEYSPTTVSIELNKGFMSLSRSALSRILRNTLTDEGDSIIYSYTIKFRDGSSNKLYKCTGYTTYNFDKKIELGPYELNGCKEIKESEFINTSPGSQISSPKPATR